MLRLSRLHSGALIVCVLLGLIALVLYLISNNTPSVPLSPETATTTVETSSTTEAVSPRSIIGTSVAGRSIESYTYGAGEKTILLVGGIHGGYEWNSILLAYEFIDALEAKTVVVPDTLTVVIIPVLNPDGLYAATGLEGRFTKDAIPNLNMHETGVGRFNQNEVDLNRNFPCKWQPESSWRSKKVSAGSAPFSEPEAIALQSVVTETNPSAVVFWHSQANAVYASECEAGVLPETLAIMDLYATAGNYDAVPSFTAYPITGDAEGWLASINIPAITVELQSRTDTEWLRNKAGVEALLNYLK